MTPKKFQIELYRFADKRPDHDQEIFCFQTSSFYSSVEPIFAKVEYSWFEYDETGPTGLQLIYDPSDPETPEGCQLGILLGKGSTCMETDLWCPAVEIDNLVDSSEDKE